jgi:hypothetical protein
MLVERVGGGPQAVSGVRKPGARRQGGGFGVAAHELAEDPPVIAPASEPAALEGLLALQECQMEAVSEREARRFGQAVLGELTKLQAGMLSAAGVARADLQRLAGLCDSVPYTEDETLRALLQSVVLRARIELARR